MELIIGSYNIEEASIDLAALLFKDHPARTKEFYAKELGISYRTLYRWIQDGRLKAPFLTKGIQDAIEKLKKAGYEVVKV